MRWLTQAAEEPEVRPGLDVEHAARSLVTVIEGFRWPVFFGAFSAQDADRILDDYLDRIFDEQV